ncbi:MAG TPA: polymer-forming cytoskeletal protein [Steroidobacteraceae bacterium]|jgi:cytoskeletal protein CcmA (bactofilin family)|nr:polymer-forming cytoskeletal protein [Steroidobacteraceae bacterium]
MFGRRERSNGRIDTLIGRNSAIQGDIEFAGGLHVDGRVAGSVRAPADGSLSVSEFGVIEGSVAASHVVLNGRVNGDIYGAERVVLGSKAKVRGNVHYGVIEMALGAEISGKLVPVGNAPASDGSRPPGGGGEDAAAEETALPMAEGL